MFRRSTTSMISMNKGAQYPGPTLQGYGRTVQKRRLEYETVESKYGKRENNKNWDVAGAEIRSTDFLSMRVYAGWPGRVSQWIFNWVQFTALAALPSFLPIYIGHLLVFAYDDSIQRAAWW
eukprot:PhF_6_TR18704/c0_g1_i1/m.27334